MTTSITIAECKTKKELRQFEEVPEVIFGDDPLFVPPYPGSVAKIFAPSAPFQKHCTFFPMIAYRNGEPVGRICATVNRSHNDYYGDRVGFFGFFDCVNDAGVAVALFAAASAKLKGLGLDVTRGPYNPTINEECGLLVAGFDTAASVMMPFNPPYYIELYEAMGLKPARDLFTFELSHTDQIPARIDKIVERVKRSNGISIRNLDVKNMEREIPILVRLYNETLDRNWGFVPITHEDLEFSAADLKAILDPQMALIAEKDGEAIGFSICIPNVNELLLRAKNRKGWLRILKFVWLMKTRQPRAIRLAIMGISPAYRNKGIAPLFYYESLLRGKKAYLSGEMSWVEETNTEVIKAIEIMGGQRRKTYRIFERALACEL